MQYTENWMLQEHNVHECACPRCGKTYSRYQILKTSVVDWQRLDADLYLNFHFNTYPDLDPDPDWR